jgi:beta-glucosidase
MPDGARRAQPRASISTTGLVDGMLARGLKPAATLYHWELPQALADQGGWRNADMPNWFADYTHTIMSRIGDRLWSAAPINEPWCVAWLSHFEGRMPLACAISARRARDAPRPESARSRRSR